MVTLLLHEINAAMVKYNKDTIQVNRVKLVYLSHRPIKACKYLLFVNKVIFNMCCKYGTAKR